MVYVADYLGKGGEFLGWGKIYANIRRRAGSQSIVPLDFMNMKWAKGPLALDVVIRDTKGENYTSVL